MHFTLTAASSRLQGREAPGQREGMGNLALLRNSAALQRCSFSPGCRAAPGRRRASQPPEAFPRKVSERSASTSIALRCSAILQLLHLS